MFILYITNNPLLVSLAFRIDDEIIRPYASRLSPDTYVLRQTPTAPISSTHEVTSDAIHNDAATPAVKSITPAVTIVYITPTPMEISISEEDLWNALLTYRTNHHKSSIQSSEALCNYARERADELFNRLQTNPDDPLDNHDGFSRDADSGYVFQKTGFNTVGENLAYTPGYTTATQIIEWGWDTSPNHRSLQLSDGITHGCITGIHPIYVGIYTY